MSTANNFTFIVLTYNHASYILEHLESIKYLIEKYGDGVDVDVIIADDASRDDTVGLTTSWLKENSGLFEKTTILSDGLNRGTCKNLTRALESLRTDYCKITAGDDVYSYENLFVESKNIDGKDIISGLPLYLIDGVLGETRFDIFNLLATNIIYENSPYSERLKKISFLNSPNVIYAVPALMNKEVTDFVNRYSVTEDYPLHVKISELYSPVRFAQVEKILVYYRRTAGSAYIIKNSQFNQDKRNIFLHLMEMDSGLWSRLLLANRLFCYGLKNRYLKLLLNMNMYLYGLGIVLKSRRILARFNKFDTQLARHQLHYDLIKSRAARFMDGANAK